MFRGAIEISITAKHRRRPGILPIGAMGLGAKVVQIAQLSGRGHLENNAAAIFSTEVCGPVVIAVGSLNQRSEIWVFTVPAAEAGKSGEGLRLGAERQTEGECRDG